MDKGRRPHFGRTYQCRDLYISQIDPVIETKSILDKRLNLERGNNLFSNPEIGILTYNEFDKLSEDLNIKIYRPIDTYDWLTIIGQGSELQYQNRNNSFELMSSQGNITKYDAQWRVAERFTNDQNPSMIIAHKDWEDLLVETFMRCEFNYRSFVRQLMQK